MLSAVSVRRLFPRTPGQSAPTSAGLGDQGFGFNGESFFSRPVTQAALASGITDWAFNAEPLLPAAASS